ncbi:hypothetical protein J3Q64DRAFT_1241742 [Phycomyces blakesleeanus]|uniref:Uncharacterized protein n=1 Tax=Phycomyces blakesleeanus TaxID=4837 RepID=A0ABR3ARG4_PHYBL
MLADNGSCFIDISILNLLCTVCTNTVRTLLVYSIYLCLFCIFQIRISSFIHISDFPSFFKRKKTFLFFPFSHFNTFSLQCQFSLAKFNIIHFMASVFSKTVLALITIYSRQ